jgi:hypothetical protein
MKDHAKPERVKTTLDEREKAFEAKYQLDETVRFKVGARRAKLLGLCAAGWLGLKDEAVAAYARTAVEADLASPGHGELLRKVRDDLKAAGLAARADQVDGEWERLEAVARLQVIEEVTAGKQSIPGTGF